MKHRQCPNCRGTGKDFYTHVCEFCRGRGYVYVGEFSYSGNKDRRWW